MEEGLALALSKKVLEGFGNGLVESLQGIEEKLAGKKPAVSKTYIFSTGNPPPNTVQHIGGIHQAIVNFQRLELVYTGLYSKEKTCRKVDPYYLFFEDSFWYLRGYCRLREEFRTFALDQIGSLKILSEHFVPEIISPEEELVRHLRDFCGWGAGRGCAPLSTGDQVPGPEKKMAPQPERETVKGRIPGIEIYRKRLGRNQALDLPVASLGNRGFPQGAKRDGKKGNYPGPFSKSPS